MRACELCQDREVAALSSDPYVFGMSWAFSYTLQIAKQPLQNANSLRMTNYEKCI